MIKYLLSGHKSMQEYVEEEEKHSFTKMPAKPIEKKITLEQFFTHRSAQKITLDLLTKTYSQENFHCYKMMINFKNNFINRDLKSNQMLMETIYNVFIKEGNKFTINISGKLRKAVVSDRKAVMDAPLTLSPNMFDCVRCEVGKLIFETFINTQFFNSAPFKSFSKMYLKRKYADKFRTMTLTLCL